MDVFTRDRNFEKQHIIDNFGSIIWTERYYGNSDVELSVPATVEMYNKIPLGTFLGIHDSDEVMILETMNIENGQMKFTGISILPWMNNRFVRTSAAHEDRYWNIDSANAGWVLWAILYYMCVGSSPYLTGMTPTGIPSPEKLAIPGLGLRSYDESGPMITVGVPFGPVYDAMYEIATTYEIGMQIVLDLNETDYLGFRSYKGLDRTSNQTVNARVRFSPQMDSFTNIKELQSKKGFKTNTYAFAPSNPGGLATTPGSAALAGDQYTGFDLRAMQVFAEDITTDQVGSDPAVLLEILNSRSQDALTNNRFVKAVDGEIVPESQLKYGIHYNLGDIIEVQGNSGTVNAARVTEYIRAQDRTGEKAYPTVTVID